MANGLSESEADSLWLRLRDAFSDSELEDALFTLTPHERRVLQVRYGLLPGTPQHTISETGRRFGRTASAVFDVQTRALLAITKLIPRRRRWNPRYFQKQLAQLRDTGIFVGSDRIYTEREVAALAAAMMSPRDRPMRCAVTVRRSLFEGHLDLTLSTFTRLDLHGSEFSAGFTMLSSRVLERADLGGCTFKLGASVIEVEFQSVAVFADSRFEGNADFRSTRFGSVADFTRAHFSRHARFGSGLNDGPARLAARFAGAVTLSEARFDDRADFSDVNFSKGLIARGATFAGGVSFTRAVLSSAEMGGLVLCDADLSYCQLEGADLRECDLRGANLTACRFDYRTWLTGAKLRGSTRGETVLLDVRWNGVQVTDLAWDTVGPRTPHPNGYTKRDAARENRQLATLLQEQGMIDEAPRFFVAARRQQRGIRGSRSWAAYVVGRFASWLLDAVSGYGFQPHRSVLAYIAVVLGFAGTFSAIDKTPGLGHFSVPMTGFGSYIVFSVMSFHGRGLLSVTVNPHSALGGVAAVESAVGLVIEVVLIATLTRRLFRG